jgi:plastocyanin
MHARCCSIVLAGLIAIDTWSCSSTSYSAGPSSPPPPPSSHATTVEARPSLAFAPSVVTIPVGDTVRFAFEAVAHNLFFDHVSGAPADVPAPTTDASVARVFTTPGSFPYACHIHPGMTGTVIVTPAS